jgi:hypothetical protein
MGFRQMHPVAFSNDGNSVIECGTLLPHRRTLETIQPGLSSEENGRIELAFDVRYVFHHDRREPFARARIQTYLPVSCGMQ